MFATTAGCRGCPEALRLAYRRPDLVKGLVTVEGANRSDHDPGVQARVAVCSLDQAVRRGQARAAQGPGPLARLLGRRHVGDRARHLPVHGRASRNLDATLKAYLGMASAREPERLAPHLVEIRCPVRLLVGTARHDGSVPD